MNGFITKNFLERASGIKKAFSEASQKVGTEMDTVLKEAAQKALEAAVSHIQGRLMDRLKGIFGGVAGSYAVKDNMPPLRNMYAALGDELEKLGQDIRFRAINRFV